MGECIACPCDVRNYADAEKAAALALEKTGRIDIVIPFAGGYEPRMELVGTDPVCCNENFG